MMNQPLPRFQIVPRGSQRLRHWLWGVLTLFWLASLLGCWLLASRLAAPQLAQTQLQLHAAQQRQAEQQRQIDELKQREVNLSLSDRISRAANNEVQTSLAERDEQIAALRADVAFYERLVGATGQRKGLNVHSAEFSREAGGSWSYTLVLTQNLNRAAISEGELRFVVEGVRAGKLASIGWDELHQKPQQPGQKYSFRYFQQLGGSVILPADFTPQRVKITLTGGGVPVNQTFDWKLAGNGRGE
jgi:hypothetical protein